MFEGWKRAIEEKVRRERGEEGLKAHRKAVNTAKAGLYGGAISGAWIGSTILPGVGTAVGLVLGGIFGVKVANDINDKNRKDKFKVDKN